ncbi:MAG TPA: Crp/Fnr family transcriptional regulator [Chloroflexota bacterium]|nr:Crp/Fnr family transcriptional regulator [Chloroflexota bacterium]
MAAETDTAALRDVTLFRDLVPAELDGLSGQVVRRSYGRNELIFMQGDRGDGLYIVVDGHVSISRQNPDGDELIYGVCEAGEYFGELALFDQEPRSASATAIDDCTCLFLSRSAFRAFVEAHPRAVLTCLAAVVAQLRRCTDLADELALLDIRSRLARRLLRLAEQGVLESDGSGRHHSSFRITQQQLASMLGATRESVNKHLSAFADQGIVRLDRGHIHVLDPRKLEECSEGLM